MVELCSCRIVESSNGGILEFGVVELSNRRVFEWWNAGVVDMPTLDGGVVELSNR